MSGYTEDAIGHNGTLDAGITLLQKPFTLHALKAKVREVLDQSTLPLEVAMSARAVFNTESRVARDKVPTLPGATVQFAFAAALPGSRGTRMAARNDVEHQSVRTSLQCGRGPAAQRTTGNQPGVAGGNRWTSRYRSRLPRRSGSLRGKRRGVRPVRHWRRKSCNITSSTAPACRKRSCARRPTQGRLEPGARLG